MESSSTECKSNPTQIQVKLSSIFIDHILETSQLFLFILKSKTKSNANLLGNEESFEGRRGERK